LCAEWDNVTLDEWLSVHIENIRAREVLAVCFQGIFARVTPPTSLLSALFSAASADSLTPFFRNLAGGPERRFVGGAQQLSTRMAAALAERVLLDQPAFELRQTDNGVIVESRTVIVRARRAIVALPPALACRLRFDPPLPLARDHLGQRTPMRWGIKAHAVYESRFWTKDGLSGQISTDGGLVRTTADSSPPSGEPGILVAFVEENEARVLQGQAASERQRQLIGELVRYFGPDASQPVCFFERNWGEDAFCRGIDGGYWPVGVWSCYGSALRKPFGRIHWAGTETSSHWNGRMEGALLAAERAAAEVAS
jgi:monoamine oxidase